MAVLLVSETLPNFKRWINNLHEIDPTLDLRTLDNPGALEDITVVLAWNPPLGLFPTLPNLKLVQSLGMGVDHLLGCHDLNKTIPVARIVDPDMKIQMSEYALYGTLKAYRRIHTYNRQQQDTLWQPRTRLEQDNVNVGLLGLGELGLFVANTLNEHGFLIHSWSSTPKELSDIESFYGDEQLEAFLNKSEVLICLLPLTQKTQDLLNYARLTMLPKGAYVINPARGQHIVDEDLIKALDEGHISGALLDVFREEPLPSTHPFWHHPAIEITPHIAAQTNPKTASLQIVNNIHRIRDLNPPINLVDMIKEY